MNYVYDPVVALTLFEGGGRKTPVYAVVDEAHNLFDRARELQLALERWWVERRAKGERRGLRPEMEALRRELEAVRFAPGRADHSETIVDLEQRLRALMRKA